MLEKYETTCVKFHIHFTSLKNELKIFLPIETNEKGRPALKWLLLDHTTLYIVDFSSSSILPLVVDIAIGSKFWTPDIMNPYTWDY